MSHVTTILVSQFWSLQLAHEINRGIYKYIGEHEHWEVLMVGGTAQELQTAIGWGVDGLVATVINEHTADIATQFGKPCVSTHGGLSFPGIPQVDVDPYETGKRAAEFFLAQPHAGDRRYATLGSSRLAGHLLRQKGFEDRVREQGRETELQHMESTRMGQPFEEGLKQLVDWLQALPLPAAVYCTNDRQALNLVLAAQQAHVDIPGQLQIMASENDAKICEGVAPSISSVRTPYAKAGYAIAEVLDAMMQGQPPPDEPRLFPPHSVVERKSTL